MFRRLIEANNKLTRNEMRQYLIKWSKEDNDNELDWEESDEEIVKWFEKILDDNNNNSSSNSKDEQKESSDNNDGDTTTIIPKITIKERIERVNSEAITQTILDMSKNNLKAVLQGFEKLFEKFSTEEKDNLLNKLTTNCKEN